MGGATRQRASKTKQDVSMQTRVRQQRERENKQATERTREHANMLAGCMHSGGRGRGWSLEGGSGTESEETS